LVLIVKRLPALSSVELGGCRLFGPYSKEAAGS
jgi:hypothetical protein